VPLHSTKSIKTFRYALSALIENMDAVQCYRIAFTGSANAEMFAPYSSTPPRYDANIAQKYRLDLVDLSVVLRL